MGGSYGYPMLTEAAKVLEEAAKVKDINAGKSALDKLEVIKQAVCQGMEMKI